MTLNEISEKLVEARAALAVLERVTAEGASLKASGKDIAMYYRDTVTEAMNDLRRPVDELETMVDRKVWPIPTYADLLFEV